jgi:hypothetical protein
MKNNKLNGIQMKAYIKVQSFLSDDRGDMAEKAAVLAAILLVAFLAFRLLGDQIAALVTKVASALGK